MLIGTLTTALSSCNSEIARLDRRCSESRIAGHVPGVELDRIGAGRPHLLAEFHPAAGRDRR